MSTASFDPFHFLSHISPDLLRQYAEKHEIGFVPTVREAGEKGAEECIAALNKSPEKEAKFWLDIYDIDEVSTGYGCDALLHRASEEIPGWEGKEYEKLRNGKERAMYFYLHHNDLFCETAEECNLETLQGWRGEKTVSKEPKEIMGNIASFEKGLKALYAKECKGSNLKVKAFEKKGRVAFVAYIEDVFASDIVFTKGDLQLKTPRKPVLTAYFLYRYEDGILDVKALGGKERIRQLQEEFIRHVIQVEPNITDQARYDFERVRNMESLKFPTEARDMVERVTLKGLRLVHNSSKTKLAIDLGDALGYGAEPMIEALGSMRIDLGYYRVTQFKLEVVFDNQGQGRKKKVTVAITHPNICDLRDREIDGVVRRLLKRWELDLF